jgi:hypothetical protein
MMGWRDIHAHQGTDGHAPSGSRWYLVALFGGLLAGLATLGAFYGGLQLAGQLPPPPLSNSVCVDEKLVFLRNHPIGEPNLLIIGSSVAWRNFNSSVVVRDVRGAKPLNGGFCGLRIHQSAFIADWLIEHAPSVREVLLMASPIDFKDCDFPGTLFDHEDVDRFVFERAPMWSFYLRYFDPISLARNIERQQKGLAEARAMGFSIEFTEYGDGPIDTDQDRGLFYGPMQPPQDACLTALRELAERLQGEGRRFMVMTTPLHPGWKDAYDPDGAFTRDLISRIAAALDGTGAEVWDASYAVLGPAAFTDAIHVRWSATDELTEAILLRFPL